jgi:hypothetical protein
VDEVDEPDGAALRALTLATALLTLVATVVAVSDLVGARRLAAPSLDGRLVLLDFRPHVQVERILWLVALALLLANLGAQFLQRARPLVIPVLTGVAALELALIGGFGPYGWHVDDRFQLEVERYWITVVVMGDVVLLLALSLFLQRRAPSPESLPGPPAASR